MSLFGEVTIRFAYYHCKHCGKGWRPWCDKLRLSDGALTPADDEIAAPAGTLGSFADGAERVYVRNGWQIGSGPVESACKTVVGSECLAFSCSLFVRLPRHSLNQSVGNRSGQPRTAGVPLARTIASGTPALRQRIIVPSRPSTNRCGTARRAGRPCWPDWAWRRRAMQSGPPPAWPLDRCGRRSSRRRSRRRPARTSDRPRRS